MTKTQYWKTRCQLAEAVIAENQIGAWQKWKDHKSKPDPLDNENLLLFGNWLLKQKASKLYIESNGTHVRLPMIDILRMFKKENGL